MKNRPTATDFTFCLPGSPKVNGGGACVRAWLPGRELLRLSASTKRISREEELPRFNTRPASRDSVRQSPQAIAGTTYDEFVQWTVQDASLGLRDRKRRKPA
jgi:hypothetical protein